MNLLPHWVLTDKFPAFYDSESKTALEQTARVYAAMQELITEYNKFVESVNGAITDFDTSSTKEYEIFTTAMSQKFQDFIDVINLKIKSQDLTIKESVDYLKTNLYNSLESLFVEMKNNGTLDLTVQKSITSLLESVNALSARMDTFTKLAEGSTTGDAELIDGHVDYKGNTHQNIGSHIRSISAELSAEIDKREHKRYGNTPFYIIDYPRTEKRKQYYSNGTTKSLSNCSPIIKAPKYLGFNLKGETRMFLYIGDIVDGEFIPDANYYISETSQLAYNYFNSYNNRILTVEEGKYFYYCIDIDEGFELIGGDEWPETKLHPDAHTPYFTTVNNGKLYSDKGYDSLFIPNGCWYLFLTENKPDGYNRNNVILSTTADVGEETTRYYNTICSPSFGFIEKDNGSTLLRLPEGCTIEDFKLYLAPDIIHTTCSSGLQERAKSLAVESIKNFRFESQKDILWSDSSRPMLTGKRFFGIPYSSRWMNSNFVGFEVSPETALNALNDSCSIAYDGGMKSAGVRHESVSGHSEINNRGGTGYGLVCSTFLSLLNGATYPQSNRGFTYDKNFILTPVNFTVSGMSLMNTAIDHCCFIDEMFNTGYTVYEGVQPCCAKSVHTGNGKYIANYERTRENYLDDYTIMITVVDRSGYETNFTDFENIEVVKGSARPWRGHKSVYGSWDKSEKGTSIGVTLHDSAAKLYVTQPSGNTIELECGGLKYLDIAQYVTEDGTYTLYTDVSEVTEAFRYFNHEDVTLSFDETGKAIFSHEDVLYCYVEVAGHGGDFAEHEPDSVGSMVIAKGSKYPELANNQDKIKAVYAAIVADPSEECWGRYSVPCTMEV